MTVSITLTDDEYKFISEYAAQKNLSTAEFMIASTLEQIEDEEDLKLYEKAEAEFNADPSLIRTTKLKKFWVLPNENLLR